MSSIAQQSLEQIIAPGNKASNTGKRAHNNNKKTFKAAGGKAISFQRRGKTFPTARGASFAAKNGSVLPTAAGRKAARIHSLKATKLAVKSISQNHRDQIVQQYLKQQQAGNQLVSKKVSVSGLPADVNESSIREFFNGAVGGVKKVQLAYNQHGKSTGQCTCVFATYEQAAALVQHYNGAPIDKGSSRLTIQLIVDADQRPFSAAPSLAARIGIPTSSKPLPASKVLGNKKKSPVGVKAPILAKKPKKVFAKKRTVKPEKKAVPSLDQLDKEMNDYFS